MRKIGNFLWAMFVVIIIALAADLIVSNVSEVKSFVCRTAGENLPRFCYGSPLTENTVEVVRQRVLSIPPQVYFAQWQGYVCVSGSTESPVGQVDTSSAFSFLQTGVDWLASSGHNLLQSENVKICSEYSVPYYMDLGTVTIKKSGTNGFVVFLPNPTLGDPAPIGDWKVETDSKLISESEVRRSEVQKKILSALSQNAKIESQKSLETQSHAVCKAAYAVRDVLISLSAWTDQSSIVWGSQYSCG